MIVRGIKVALLLCFVSTFGFAEFNPEIVGGTPADYEKYAFYSIPDISVTNYVCGATVIHEDILLTAASCDEGWYEGVPAVITPSGGRRDPSPNETHQVDFAVAHPGFRFRLLATNFLNDIMLVKLATSTNVTPVVLNTQSSVPAVGETMKVIGFGYTTDGGLLSPDLLEVDIGARPARDCRLSRKEDAAIICSGNIGAGICLGDAGGPLLTQGNAQVGVVSFLRRAIIGADGNGCADDFPDGFTRVSAYHQWIQDGICCMSSNPPQDCGQLDCAGYLNDSGCLCGRFSFLCRLLNRCLF